jgi:hypothetical protein
VIPRRLDLAGGVLFIERHPRTILLDIPRGRLPLVGVAELNEVIAELMMIREELLEGPAEFIERTIGHA